MPLVPLKPGTTTAKTLPEYSDAEVSHSAEKYCDEQIDHQHFNRKVNLSAFDKLIPEARRRNLPAGVIEKLQNTYFALTGKSYAAAPPKG